MQRPLSPAEVEFLASLCDPQVALCGQFPGLQRFLEAAIVERRLQDEQRIHNLNLEIGKIVQDRRLASSAVSRRRLTVQTIKTNPLAFKARLIAKAKIQTFDELRLADVIARNHSL